MTNPFQGARVAGLDAIITLSLAGISGGSVAPSEVKWRVVDELDQALIGWTQLVLPSGPVSELSVTVPGALNTLPAGEVYGMRTVELQVTIGGAQSLLNSTYALEASTKLVPMVNSYGTINQLLVASQYAPSSDVMHLTGASEDDRFRALLGSYIAIEQLPLMVVSDNGKEMGWLRDMDAATRTAKIEPQMRRALMTAQILDAANVLAMPFDAVHQARMKGLVSMTVGESSQFFGTARPLEMPIARNAMRTLARYLRRSVRLGRA